MSSTHAVVRYLSYSLCLPKDDSMQGVSQITNVILGPTLQTEYGKRGGLVRS